MRLIYTILFGTLLLLACDLSGQVVVHRLSDLQPELYSITGDAYLEEFANGDLQLRLSQDFDTPPGPDVRILLGEGLTLNGAVEIVNLSDIGHFSGELIVDVPSSVSIDDFDFILFFCVAFNQFWASGEFGPEIVSGPSCEESSVDNANGSNIIDICPSDGSDDVVEFENSLGIDAGDEYAYLITDNNQILQEVILEDEFDFEGSTSETQRVYGLHYDGNLDINIGSPRTQTTASGCFEHSDNSDFIIVNKNACFVCQSSFVDNANGLNTVNICPSDNIDDVILFENSLDLDAGDEYAYLITDENEDLIEVVFEDSYNFEGSGEDEYRVYGMHYNGVLIPEIGDNRLETTASDCFEHSSSNRFVRVIKDACFQCLESTTFIEDSTQVVNICPIDGLSDSIRIKNSVDTSLMTMNYAYIVTDTFQIAQQIVVDTIINFEGTTLEDQRVYGIHYSGTLIPQIGLHRNETTATQCFMHSDSLTFLSIIKDQCPPPFACESSTVSSGVNTQVNICPSDGLNDIITLNNSLNATPGINYAYLITDSNEIVQDISVGSTYNFEGSSAETQRVYGIHFDGDLIPVFGQSRFATSATGCFTHSTGTFLSVIKDACPPVFECLANSVTDSNGNTTLSVCPNDGTSDLISFNNNLNEPAGTNYVYLLTDANDILQELIFANSFDFEGTSDNTQRVYGMHYDGVLIPAVGQTRTATTATECFTHSSGNFLEIIKDGCIPIFQCLNSTVASNLGNNISICPSDGEADIVSLSNSLNAPLGVNYVYLLTDQNEVLQQVISSTSFNFEGSSDATQRIYGLHFNGTLIPAIGQNRTATTASECFQHSNAGSFVTITKDACPPPFQCLASTTSSNGSSSLSICPDDGSNDIITLSNSLNIQPGENYVYLLTDANERLQRIVTTNNFNFEGSGLETQRVYGMHFDGNLSPVIGANRLQTTATGCFTHSSGSFLTITKDACIPPFDCQNSNVSTGTNQTSINICPTDGNRDEVIFTNSLNELVGVNYAYIITDVNEIVQQVLFTDRFNFEGSGLEEQRVFGVHYSGTLTPQIGQSRFNTRASDCEVHSTGFVSVSKGACIPDFECLENITATTNWATVADICPGDGVADIVELRNNLFEEPGEHYAYLITDTNDILMEVVFQGTFDFESSGTNELRVYGIHFDGDLIPAIGQNRRSTTASRCFAHSGDTFLTITKNACAPPPFDCEESLTATTNWETSREICPTDGEADIIELRNNLFIEPGENYAYLITDVNEILLEISFEGFMDFEGSGLEEQRVYGIHYDGDLNPAIGANRRQTTATGCFTHSGDNLFLTIAKTGCISNFVCEESLTATTNWATSTELCVSDGEEDLVELRNNLFIEPGDNYAYLITDENEVVIDVSFEMFYDFEGSGPSDLRVYGVHFDGTLNPVIGADRRQTTASGCFIHSGDDLFLTIIKMDCGSSFVCEESLTATTNWATSTEICATDGEADIVELRNNLFIDPGVNYAYLITDENEIVIDVTLEGTYDFEGTGTDILRVYGIHFDGTLNPELGLNRRETTATGCFIHSGDNLFLTIEKLDCEEVFQCRESLTATHAWITSVDVCAGDGIADEVFLQNNIMDPVGENYAFLLTDEFEVLQEIILDSIYNFEDTGFAEQRIYGMSYDGELNARIGEDRKNTTASECFIHSGDNLFITINKTAACETSTDDNILIDQIRVFPNPSNGEITISYNEGLAQQLESVRLFDNQGKLINNLPTTATQISIEDSGLYFIQFSTSDAVVTKKLFVN